MPIPTDPAADPGLSKHASENVAPFIRTVTAAAPDREPRRPTSPNTVAALDGLSEIRAMVGLVSLATEGLPAPYSGEFSTTLELIHAKIGAAMDALQHGSGQPPLKPVRL